MIIEIDNFKCPSLNILYAGVHWAKRKKMVDEIHQLVYYQAINKEKFNQPVKISYEIHYKGKRRHDPDNAAIKIFTDGLVLAGVLKDDSLKEIKEISITMKNNQPTDKIIIKIDEKRFSKIPR